jgi:hypothetical protein
MPALLGNLWVWKASSYSPLALGFTLRQRQTQANYVDVIVTSRTVGVLPC